MEYALLGWPEDGPTLRLDYRRFSYAGKFVMSGTGKAVARDEGDIVAAAAFDADRTDDSTLRIRYVTVREDRRGAGIGSRLLAFVRERAADRGYEQVLIAVNNPFAYEAASKAGFGYSGEETGIAELVMAWPADRETGYTDGLSVFNERDLSAEEQSFVSSRGSTPPETVDPP